MPGKLLVGLKIELLGGEQVCAVELRRNPEGLAKLAWSVRERLGVSNAPPLLHQGVSGQWLNRPDKNGSADPCDFGNDVHTMVYSIDQIDVAVPASEIHRCMSRPLSEVAM